MSNRSRRSSPPQEHTYGPPMTFVPGVGEVPSGPRSWLTYFGPEAERRRRESSFRHRTTVKQENTDEDPSIFMPAVMDEDVADGEILERNLAEGLPAPAAPMELDADYQHIFSSLLAASARSTRSDTNGSLRQDTSEGTLTRSEPLVSSTDHELGRSSHGSRTSGHNVRSERSGSALFYPDSGSESQHSQAERVQVNTNTREQSGSSLPELSNPSEERSISQVLSTASQETSPSDETEEVEDTRCRCPIGYFCAVRTASCLDCRPLVGEYGTWTQRRDEEAFERHKALMSNGTKFVTVADLLRIVNHLNRFVTAASQYGRDAAVSRIRAWIMDMADVTITFGTQQDTVNQQVLPALRNFLAPASASVRQTKNLPAYIEEELTVLERKWGKGDFDGDTKRGLLAVEVLDVNGNLRSVRLKVDQTWPFYVSAKYFGAGDLVNGQIWESRVELQRDGVHAPQIAGISGTSKEGARSVVLGSFDEKHNVGYADIDMGEVIEYVGTALKDQEGLGPTNIKDPHMSIPNAWDQNAFPQTTAATKAMFTSLETKAPVRVIRSFKMCDIVTNKPSKGYRYDGLYRVVRATALKEARQIWSFRMVREPDQLPAHGPLRGFANGPRRRENSGRRVGHFTKT